MTNIKYILSAAILAGLTLIWTAGALADDSLIGNDVVAPAGGDKDAAAENEQAQRNMEAILKMSPEELDKFLKHASQDRLRTERQQVVAEITGDVLNDAAQVQAAVKLINDKPADTQADNIDRFLHAFSLVEERLGGPYKLYQQGLAEKDETKAQALFLQAAEALKLILAGENHSNLSAAEHYLCAMALAKANKDIPAVEIFNAIAVTMSERISFAAAATMEAAKLYDKLGRGQYAMEMYAYCLQNYGLTLGVDEAKKIAARVEEIQAIYKDPFNTMATRMDEVKTLLEKADTGKPTQDKEKQIALVLNDLIQTIEEKDQQKPPPENNQKKDQGKGEGKGEGEGKDGKEGKGESKSKQPGPPSGNPKKPSGGANLSRVVPGPTARPTEQSVTKEMAGTDDWSNLPPREQEQLRELAKKAMAERYRDIISDYNTKIAEHP